MLASAIASCAVLAKSLILIAGSPRASRWALMIIRRYLLTETPGIATGYWKAMKRPACERVSGSASVMSSPLKTIEPSVTSSAGWPMITLASVDLPDPLGPISACTLPFSTSRSRPLRISFSSTRTCRLRISSSANFTHSVSGVSKVWDSGGAGDRGLAAAAGPGELDQLGQRGAGQRLGHAALHARPQQLRRTGAVAVVLVRAEHFALGRLVEALHRRDLPFQCPDPRVHRDLLGRLRQAVAAVGAAGRGDQARLAQFRDQVLEVGEGEPLGFGDSVERDRRRTGLAAQLDHQSHSVLGFGRKQHRPKSYRSGRLCLCALGFGFADLDVGTAVAALDQDQGEDEAEGRDRGAAEEGGLEALGERVLQAGAGAQQVFGVRGRQRGEHGQPQRTSHLLGGVDEPARQSRLLFLDAGDGGDGRGHEGEAEPDRGEQ